MRVTIPLAMAVVERCRPSGWGIQFSRKRSVSLSGEARVTANDERTIRMPALVPGTDLRHALFIFFHECYHALTWEMADPRGHVDEYQAERHAINMMRDYGINVRRKDTSLAKWRVRQMIKQDERRGIAIDPRVRRWARAT